MKVFIVGGTGFLGSEVVRQSLAADHRVTATYHSRRPDVAGPRWQVADISDRQLVADLMATENPDVVINAAFRQADWASTADGAAHVALAAASVAARLVHVSSDAVFSGAAIHYDETATPRSSNSHHRTTPAFTTSPEPTRSAAMSWAP